MSHTVKQVLLPEMGIKHVPKRTKNCATCKNRFLDNDITQSCVLSPLVKSHAVSKKHSTAKIKLSKTAGMIVPVFSRKEPFSIGIPLGCILKKGHTMRAGMANGLR